MVADIRVVLYYGSISKKCGGFVRKRRKHACLQLS